VFDDSCVDDCVDDCVDEVDEFDVLRTRLMCRSVMTFCVDVTNPNFTVI
jgi:hypothetical protein